MIRYSRSARSLAICLASLAGFVDAIGFLLTGGLFLSFMSGNSTRLAVGLAEQALVAWLAATLIASFVSGVVIGSLISARWPALRKALVLITVAGLIAIPLLLDPGGRSWLLPVLVAMGMGCANTVFQRDGDVTIGVTYMTGALVKLGQRIADALRGGNRWDWLPFLLLWSGLVAGALCGALLYAHLGVQSLWIAVVVALLLSLWARWIQLREGR